MHLFLTPFNTNNGQNRSIWPIDRTLKGTTTWGQSGPWSNANERVTHTLHIPRTGVLTSDAVNSHIQDSLTDGLAKQLDMVWFGCFGFMAHQPL